MTRQTPCSGTCGATIRRRGWGFCRRCSDQIEASFRRAHSPLDADWGRARSLFFGDRAACIAALATTAPAPLAGQRTSAESL